MTRAYSIVVVHGISGPKTWVRFPVCSFFINYTSVIASSLFIAPNTLRSSTQFRLHWRKDFIFEFFWMFEVLLYDE